MEARIWVPVAIAIAGLLLWLFVPRLSEPGKYMFICGVFWATYACIGDVVRIGRG